MDIEIRHISTETKVYQMEVALRSRVLREPLGLKFSAADLAPDQNDYHFGAFAIDTLLGCLILSPLDDETIRMRQLAVESASQGKGIGSALVNYAEEYCWDLGFDQIILHARESAIPFYLKHGYEIFDGPFTAVNLPHRKMRKMFE